MSHRELRIVHVASGDLWGGAEAQLYTLCGALETNHDCNVIVILLNYGELERRLKNLNIKVHVINEASTGTLSIFRQLYKIIKNTQPDVVHTHRFKENILGSLASLFNKNTPSIRTSHGILEYLPSWKFPAQRTMHVFERFLGRFIQKKIIAVSDELSEKLAASFSTKKILTIENGIDINKLSNFKKPDNTSTSSKQFQIGIVGRLIKVKRVDLFIQLAHLWQLNPTHKPCKFHIFGDGPLQAELTTLSSQLELGSSIKFHGHVNEIYAEISQLDVLVITSDHEGLPMTLLEGLYLKTSILARAVGGIPVVLNNGEYGTLIDSNAPESFQLGLEKILDNSKEKLEISKKAKEMVIRKYSAQHNASQYLALYKSLALNSNQETE